MNGLVPFEGISVSDSRVKANSNCLLQILALSRVSVFKIPFSLSEVIPNASCLRDLTKFNDCHRLNCDYSLGGVMGSVLMCIFSVD